MPATDDEIMEVADLLKDETMDVDIVPDNERSMYIDIKESSNATAFLESSGFCLNIHLLSTYAVILKDYLK